MTDHGDDADDDAQLKSLRAVWLAMPDEDPPERGLAELMAAARIKAEQMAKPSLWQRISALLRRPPVLALATVLVLIGGAVFIGKRHNEMATESVATQSGPDNGADRGGERARDNAAGSAATVEAPALAKQEPMPTAPVEPKPPEPETAAVPNREEEQPPRPSRPSHATPRVETKPKTEAQDKKSDAKKGEAKHTAAPSNGVVGGSEGRQLQEKESVSGGDSYASPDLSANKDYGYEGAKTGAAQSSADAAPTTTASPPPPTSPTGSSSSSSRAAQYLAQARSAAARGDCSAARTMMKRAANEDAATYKKALASDAALKKCAVAAQ